jgi:predicted acylesterase/phospholipase RssA
VTRTLLAIDGGGIRGLIPAHAIAAIEARMGRPACELFDMIAGTSTGGIIALGLVTPQSPGSKQPAFSAADLEGLYVNQGHEIFSRPLLRRLANPFGLFDVRYGSGAIERIMRERFGRTMLSEALVEVVVPSYDLSSAAPFFFKRRYAQDEEHSWDVEMWHVARATSAAPTYFEPAELPPLEQEGPHALVDGGVFANNPAACAYADAIADWGHDAEIHVVSIGTGQPPQVAGPGSVIPVPYRRARHWGVARWARPLLEVVFDGVADSVEYQLSRLCRHGSAAPMLHRLQSPLPTANHAMDDASPRNIQRLRADAAQMLEDQAETFDAICGALSARGSG